MASQAPASPLSSADPTRIFQIFVIHHTHWDREWWGTFQDIRYKLVHLIDGLLDVLEADPGFRTFLLDSQTIVLRDYLEVRPEQRERLVAQIRAGRVECGPWYILPDEFLVDGEAHIRNLLLARRIGRELDIPLLSIGYIPDTFGHISQMPQILRGFGIDNAFIWRGYGGPEARQEFHWESPNGSSVQTHWFPEGYYWMPFLHFGNPDRPDEDKVGRVVASIERWGPRATTDVLLLPYGGDHRPYDPHLAGKIDLANAAIEDLGVAHWGRLQEYVNAIRERNPDLETVRGELRGFGLQHPQIFPGVLSARMYLKTRNFACETLLERYTEPLNALAWQGGSKYDAGMLWKAWDYLIQNHPHDSICGCSVEPVHREMLTRFDQAEQLGEILASTAAETLNAAIDTSYLAAEDRAIVVHNTDAQERSGWTAVRIAPADIDPRTHVLMDATGREIAFQVRPIEGRVPLSDQWFHTEIGFVADEVPALGHRMYRLQTRTAPEKRFPMQVALPVAEGKGDRGETDLRIGGHVLENAFLRVQVELDGTLTVTDRSTGFVYRGLNAFEDGGDAGDTYSYSPPLIDTVLRSPGAARAHVTLAEAGQARAALRVDLDWALPESLTEDRRSRAPRDTPYRISSFISLAAGERHVEIETRWENTARDHRLRVLFPLGASPEWSWAQGHFDVVRRPVHVPNPGTGWPEVASRQHPMGDWVSVDAAGRGLTIATRGLPEYEVLEDGTGTVAVTLLRAVGWLSRDDTLQRSGGAGPGQPTPDAQCLGPNRVAYAIVPHASDWLTAEAYRTASGYLHPLYGTVTDHHAGSRPGTQGLIHLTAGHTFEFSACKKADHTDSLILRFWNVAGRPTATRLSATVPLGAASLVDLREEWVRDLPVMDNGIDLQAGPHEIVTVALTFDPEGSA